MSLRTGLVSYWNLNAIVDGTTAVDSVGSNDGTLTGTASVDDGGVSFEDGAYFDCGNDASLQITDPALTLNAWVKIPATTGHRAGIINKSLRVNDSLGYFLDKYETRIRFDISEDGQVAGRNTIETTDYPLDEWFMATGIIRSGHTYLYINGILKDDVECEFEEIFNTPQNLFINKSFENRSNPTHIKMAGVWNRGLTPEEVAILFNGGLGQTFPFKYDMTASSGEFSLVGTAVDLIKAIIMSVLSGAFSLIGKDAILRYSGWTKDTKPTSSWTNQDKPTSSWTNQDKPTSSWTNDTK